MIHTAQALVDVVVEVATLPRRGGNVVAAATTEYAASAVNVLAAAARSGAQCVHAGSIGTGPRAELVRSALAAEGVVVSSPRVPGLDTGVCIVLLEANAERTFITTEGAERLISVESLETSAPQPGDVVCVSGYSLAGRTRDPLLVWLSRLSQGVDVVLDPGAAFAELDPSGRTHMIEMTTVWTGNAEESEALTGRAEISEAARAAYELMPRGRAAIVRDGARGCAVATESDTRMLPGYPQTAVDTNGAGDAHTGIMLAGFAAGLGWLESAVRANAGAAIKVTRRGPATAPTAADIDAFLVSQSA